MKATGIVRRIDDLGRVVIPKEIRRTMRIRGGPVANDIVMVGNVLLRNDGFRQTRGKRQIKRWIEICPLG